MNIKLSKESSEPVYLQIASGLTRLIEQGELVDGFKLPSERKLAEELGVHRNTVIKAYQELIADGKVTASRQKPKGYFVKNPYDVESFTYRFFPLESNIIYEESKASKELADVYWRSDYSKLISFGGIVAGKKMKMLPELGSIFESFFENIGNEEVKAYRNETDRLKQNLCNILSDRNIYASPKNIQIFAETNQALHYLIELFLKEGDKVIVDDPCIPDVINIFSNKGIETVPVALELDGMDIEALETAIRTEKPKFIYTMPSYQNPTGITTSLEKRLRILEIANKYSVPIIEDDYMSEFRFDDNRLPSLYMLDHNKSVVYIDSFTLLFPAGTKLGFIACPPDLSQVLETALSVDETFTANISQYMINQYVESGFYREQCDEIRKYYKAKCELLCSELDKLSSLGVHYVKPRGGLVLWVALPESVDEMAFSREAERRGVLTLPGWTFKKSKNQKRAPSAPNGIRLCFSNLSDEQIVEGVRILSEILREFLAS